jgi:NtrC-family two-component system sensor histidine kinase KinB
MTTSKTNSNHTTSSLKLSEEEIALRKQWLELKEEDEEIIRKNIDQVVENNSDELITSMYSHFLSFDETRAFFPDEKILNRAQAAQKEYFIRLTKGNYGIDYVTDRLQVGSTHHRIELDPKWYIGAYNQVLTWLLKKLIVTFKDNSEALYKTISALLKIIFFDMGLAIESYIGAKESAIKKHRDVISELETEKRVTKSILESAPIGIVHLSEDLICLECNDEFVNIIDVSEIYEVIGKSIFAIAPGLAPSTFKEVLKSGQPYKQTADSINLSKDIGADKSYWDWATWPVKDHTGKPIGLVAMFANATDRVLLQQQREDFVATLTHDLKTPVLATNRAVQLLLEGDFGPITESQDEVLKTILQSNKALYTLVQTLLDVYRFDSGVKEMHMQNINLSAIVMQMITEIMPLAQAKGVELKALLPADSKDVFCDEDEIRRVIQNLIDNSLKYTPTGGSITVSMNQENDKTTINVSDTGKGIPEENKPKLFQRFWQAGSTGRYYASTGLGLYLCRRIIEGHSGKIWFESTLGQGSTFSFEL